MAGLEALSGNKLKNQTRVLRRSVTPGLKLGRMRAAVGADFT
jgi:hypothetical protein